MKSLARIMLLGTALLIGGQSVAQDGINVDLKSFRFKVADKLSELFGYNDGEEKLFFYTNGVAEATLKLPADAEYELRIKAACDPAQNERARFKVSIDGQPAGKEVLLTQDEPREYKLAVKLKAGERKLAIEFTNDVYKEGEYDRNLYVHGVSVDKLK